MEKLNIPILDLKPQIETLWPQFTGAVEKVLKSGQFILGDEVAQFEKEMASYIGVKHAIGVNSGTDGLLIGLRAAGVGPGDEVITTPFTFFATAEVVSLLGATPVFVDIEADTFNIDTKKIAAKITKKTKAIIPVHLYGQSTNMAEIMKLAKDHNLKVVEDVAQATGASFNGKKLGSIGDVGAFSFFPSKNLGAFGDGGMITTNDDKIAELSRMMRMHGSKKRYYNEMIAYNSRLDAMQAAILRVKLPHLDQWNKGRKRVAAMYHQKFSKVSGVTTGATREYADHVWHQYTIRITNGKRDQVHNRLTEMGISTMLYYPVPVHQLPVYNMPNGTCPIAEATAAEVMSLPIWPELDEATADKVVGAIASSL